MGKGARVTQQSVAAVIDQLEARTLLSGRTPAVLDTSFEFEPVQAVRYKFTEDVSASLSGDDVQVVNLTTGLDVPASSISVTWDPATKTARFTFPPLVPGGALPDGNWRATLLASGVNNNTGQPLPADVNLEFFSFAGDADRSRTVTIADFARLAARFNQPGTFSLGDFNYDGIVGIADFALLASNFNRSVDALPLSVSARLASDTGLSSTDRVTRDPSMLGSVLDPQSVADLRGAIDSPPAGFISLLSDLNPDGTFALSPVRLAALNGGPALSDGPHLLRLRTLNGQGQLIGYFDLPFVLDTTPTAPVFSLDPSTDTPPIGDGQTSFRLATFSGTAEAGSRLSINGLPNGPTATDNSAGQFARAGVPWASRGPNAVPLRSPDGAGNGAPPAGNVTRIAPAGDASFIYTWIEHAMTATIMGASSPPMTSRNLAIASTAMYDAINAVQGASAYFAVRVDAPADASAEAAASAAAQRVLAGLYPAQATDLQAKLDASLAAIPDGPAETAGVAVGRAVADRYLLLRADDNAYRNVPYLPASTPGGWQSTPPNYEPAVASNWPLVTPFVMSSADQFRPGPPPSLTSTQYATEFNEIKAIGKSDSTTRTADQTAAARFWRGGGGTVQPPGHWNKIAESVADDQNLQLADAARLFAQLNVAMADAGIAAWDAKFHYSQWRPVTAIRSADTDGNPTTAEDRNWLPLLTTPPFPDYVSGHATYSGAASAVLAARFGSSFSFVAPVIEPTGTARPFTSFAAAAQEAANSRLWAGIHFRSSNETGLSMGQQIGALALQRFAETADTTPPLLSVQTQQDQAFNADFNLVGRVIDGLSVVTELEYRPNGTGPWQTLTFDPATGEFTLPIAIPADGSADGARTVQLRATDGAGNQSGAFEFRYVADTVAPTINVTTPTMGSAVEAGALLSGSVNATGSTIRELGYRLNGGQLRPLVFGGTDNAYNEPLDLSSLAPGSHTLTVRAVDAAGNPRIKDVDFTIADRIPLTVIEVEPAGGSGEVGVTQRPKVVFSRAVDPASLSSANLRLSFSGQTIPATIVPSKDNTFAWLFPTSPMPGGSTITLTIGNATPTSSIKAAADNAVLDGDADGTPGGVFTQTFTTVSSTPVPTTQQTNLAGQVISTTQTRIVGTVADPGPDRKPGTNDDSTAGPDGLRGTADDVYTRPIAGAKVYILGLASQFVLSAADGTFVLSNVPPGTVKLAVDGRTATNAPGGIFFPEMTMDLTVRVGADNTVSDAQRDSGEALSGQKGVYLPRLDEAAMTPVSTSQTTLVELPDADPAGMLSQQQRDLLQLEVTPGSLIGMNGQIMTSGTVGISTVPPQLVLDMMPPGLLEHTFDITIQAPGVAQFAEPLQITFPNVYNAAPGTKLNFLSFDHESGRLVIEGTATVSPDGGSVTSDAGTGVIRPGWHGLTNAGNQTQTNNQGQPWYENIQNNNDVLVPGDTPQDRANRINIVMQNTGNLLGNLGQLLGNFVPVIEGINTFLETTENLHEAFQNGNFEPLIDQFNPFTSETEDTINDISDGLGNVQEIGNSLNNIGQQINQAEQIRNGQQRTGRGGGPYAAALQAVGRQAALVSEQIPRLQALRTAVTQVRGWLLIANPALPALGLSPAQQAQFSAALGSVVTAGAAVARGTSWTTATRSSTSDTDRASTDLATFFGGVRGPSAQPRPPHCVLIETGGQRIRQRVRPNVAWDAFLPADSPVRITAYDPAADQIGRKAAVTDAAGRIVNLGYAFLGPPTNRADADGDGLVDEAEQIVGTRPNAADSDGDGVSDFAELRQGSDPLSGLPVATGVTASLSLQGQAKSVEVSGSTTRAGEQTAYVATGSHGIVVVDVSNFQRPLVRGQLDLPGDATDVAVDPALGIAAVATNAGGLIFVNVADPTAPTIARTLNVNSGQVEVSDGIAYAAVGGELRSYDLLTGEWLQSLSLSSGTIRGIAREGTTLYTMDSNRVLRAVQINGLSITATNSQPVLPTATGKLVVGDVRDALGNLNKIAFVAAGNGSTGGFVTVNVNDPGNMMLLSPVDANNVQGQAIAVNGSGLAVSVGSLIGGTNSLDVLNVRDPNNTGAFVTRITLPAAPQDVTIAGGLAFVADGTAGLEVVNYLAFDNQGLPPELTVDPNLLDIDTNTPGIQVQEGSNLRLRGIFNDDVQVRNVELLLDGNVVRNDVSFPFDLSTVAPLRTATVTTATLQVRATDTGGNVTTSPVFSLDLVPDIVAPTLVSTNPPDGAVRGQSFRAITLTFSEPLDQSTVTPANFVLTGPGNQVVQPQNIQFRAGGSQVQLTYPQLVAGTHTLTVNAANVKDRAGNAIGGANITRTVEIREATAVWINPSGGFWDVASNWDTGVVPGANDDVLIEVTSGGVVTYRTGSNTVRSVEVGTGVLTLTGGTFTVTNDVSVRDRLQLAGGTLANTTILNLGPGQVSATSGTLTGVTLASNISIGNGQSLAISNGLTLVGGATITLGATSSTTYLYVNGGTQTIGGTGQIVFAGTSSINRLRLGNGAATTLTLGPGVTVRGQGSIDDSSTSTLTNQGTIQADVSGQTLSVSIGGLTNTGTLAATGGGTLNVNNFASNQGVIRSGAGSIVNINGAFTNASSGTLRLDIGGTSTSQFGRIAITGAATLAGILELPLVNGFVPTPGNQFQIMTYASRNGGFDAPLPAGFTLNYNGTNLTAVAV